MVDTLDGKARAHDHLAAKSTVTSFLKPLNEIGSEFFWVWPVVPGDRIEAILAVGYREAPASDSLVAECGGQLRASARDRAVEDRAR